MPDSEKSECNLKELQYKCFFSLDYLSFLYHLKFYTDPIFCLFLNKRITILLYHHQYFS